MATARLIRKIEGWRGDAALYELSEPLGVSYDDEANKFNHVIVSAADVAYTGPETYIFGADVEGNVVDWGELDGSFHGSLDHAAALKLAGYDLATP